MKIRDRILIVTLIIHFAKPINSFFNAAILVHHGKPLFLGTRMVEHGCTLYAFSRPVMTSANFIRPHLRYWWKKCMQIFCTICRFVFRQSEDLERNIPFTTHTGRGVGEGGESSYRGQLKQSLQLINPVNRCLEAATFSQLMSKSSSDLSSALSERACGGVWKSSLFSIKNKFFFVYKCTWW